MRGQLLDGKSNQEIWVYTEHKNGKLLKVAREVLSEGRRLADQMKKGVVAVLLGYNLEKLVEDIGKHGADKILLIDNPDLENYSLLPYCGILAQLIQARQPFMVLFGATLSANDLASRLAARIKAGLVTNCNLLEISEDGVLEATKPAYGGNVSATLRFSKNKSQLVTISPGATEISTAARKPEINRVDVKDVSESIVQSLGFLKGDPETLDLSEAELVIAGGRGMGNEKGFQLLEELARLLGASVGGTRVAVDSGWIPFQRQIGQTGKTTSPRFFMTLGASGAIHYTMGFKAAEFILAVDKNPRAPIFELADIGVVADVCQVLPALLSLLESKYQANNSLRSLGE